MAGELSSAEMAKALLRAILKNQIAIMEALACAPSTPPGLKQTLDALVAASRLLIQGSDHQ
jgi:hypothetical protein